MHALQDSSISVDCMYTYFPFLSKYFNANIKKHRVKNRCLEIDTVGSGFWPLQSLDLDSVNLNRDPQIYRLETKIGTFLRLCFTAGRILIRWWLYSYFWGILYPLSNHMLVSQVSNYLFFLRCLGIFPWQFASNCWQLCCRLLKRIHFSHKEIGRKVCLSAWKYHGLFFV